jgi:predicted DNA-binding antitoxin AbrB/MazE fold protein
LDSKTNAGSPMTVQAIYENGVFRPVGPVPIPDKALVEFEPRVVNGPTTQTTLDDIYGILGRRFDSGETDVAKRHNEHQP